MSAPVQHPMWCFLESCTVTAGGTHVSRSRVVPDEQVGADRPVIVDLVEAATGGPRVRLVLEGGPRSRQLTLDGARMLARALRDLSIVGAPRQDGSMTR